ncbi:DNA polymerase III subunit beta [Aurantiacibacter aquimixticola]|uniref:Beta sliding clamp n=1 Tax=Aurantiacibacter aquimixticola TaxID=1958945 RepID=A0A419RSM8_9SPHN|nr:DNA polymerase III subunit beta [Aurantiacibacter aquimixticola]RJY08788.1 DNA polymerase III subunit beta [Aurantiacibacter aquimixticola]
MKVTIERAELLRSLSHVQSVVERRNTIPILSNVLIEAEGNSHVRIMATDLDLQVVDNLQAHSVDSEGSITVSAHLLFDIARKLPDGSQVSLETGDNRMTIKAGRSRFSLPTLPRDDFPVIVEGDLPTSFELPAKTLAELIDRTRFAISTEETRYYLNGIFLHVADEDGGVLKAAATDGHRLARFTLSRPDGAQGMPDVIVPRKAVVELRKLLEEAMEGNVQIDLSPSKIRFTLGGEGGVVLTSKLIDGTFPDYSRVIPTGNDKLLKVDPKSLFAGVDRVATIATEKTRAVKMGLENDKVTLTVTSPDNGNAVEEVSSQYGSDALEIGFNASYLKDILQQLGKDTVELHFADAGAPTLIREDENSPALYVLMPMRV